MKKSRSVLLAIGAFLLANFKWLIGILKFSKFGTTLLSMVISLWAYAMFYGWKFAVALVYLIFVHEMGHVIAAKRKGIATSPAVFIPFAGAFISMKDMPRDAKTEAYLAYGGPLAGMIAFLPALPLYWWTQDPFWALVIYLGALLNLFNLLPVSPLDGGRIVSVLSTKIWFFGLVGLGIMLFANPGPIMVLIFIIGLITWWSRLRESYQHQVLQYERDKIADFLQSIAQWPELETTWDTRVRLNEEVTALNQAEPDKGFLVPFLQDEKRLIRDRKRLDKVYMNRKWELFKQWEREPILFIDSDPLRPAPSELLREAEQMARQRLTEIEEQMHRLTTYYVAPAATKWKVLAAYLGLAAVLSAFFVYGQQILHR
ncbi:site-2 protease family protein [Brevibacillus agri]|uniref:site-2 protease family protein n=1 Tax=Brevibacillus agri TaxID=51101 RepID=UPI0018CD0913|nr:site-2 protease family protein [Brevibacillus agri]MBG9567281.1 Zn-dependent protease [Brevibacillus agri]MDR9503860.1 site-2 protease family protein [Brevibacillus agri]MED1644542.1 site-2 protease family protein [Brevibacillus agri]MED1654831.1 site-2 protease family protein [Brevibacillus agri]MED1687561.1 site-2 protease family protein [Brevibacillus agri]